MNNNTLKFVCAASGQLGILLGVLTSCSICVRVHVELERKRNLGFDFRGRAITLLKALSNLSVDVSVERDRLSYLQL